MFVIVRSSVQVEKVVYRDVDRPVVEYRDKIVEVGKFDHSQSIWNEKTDMEK